MSEDKNRKLSFWEEHGHHITLDNFRTPGFLGEAGSKPHALNYIMNILERTDWLDICKEDGAWNVMTEMCSGRLISRDLVDSIVEIDWINRTLQPDQWKTVLDIGAGYGRIAHRLHQLFPEKKVVNTDMIENSLKCCKKYMEFRNVPAPVYRGTDLPDDLQIDLAINIHSFPELRREEIEWWMDWLVAHKVPRFFLIPHCLEDPNDEMLLLYDMKSFKPEILARGYEVEHHWVGPPYFKRYFYMLKNPAFIK